MQPLHCPPEKGSQEGTRRTRAQGEVQTRSWIVPGPGLHLSLELCPLGSLRPSIWPQVPSIHLCALQPGASWIAECARHHCSNTPLGAVLVRSPISCPPLNETECAKVSASRLLLQHGLRPRHQRSYSCRGRSCVQGRGRTVSLQPVCVPALPPQLHISPCVFVLTTSHATYSHITWPHTHASKRTLSQVLGTLTDTPTQAIGCTCHRDIDTSACQCIPRTVTHHGTLAHAHHADTQLSPVVGTEIARIAITRAQLKGKDFLEGLGSC